jgi:flavodoxin/ferredoxin
VKIVSENVAIVYFSQTKNTEQVAGAVVRGLEKSGARCDLMRLEKTDPATLRRYDLIGLGTPVFYYKEPYNVLWFLKRLDGMAGKSAFLFLTEGGNAANTFLRLQKRLNRLGLTVVDTFKCLWYDTYPPFIGVDRQKGHPDAAELAAAETFGEGLIRRRDRIRAGETRLIPTFTKVRDRYHRMSVILTRVMLYMVSPKKVINTGKCTKCGVCVNECPTENIRLDPFPKFAWRCIYCYWCERVCPEGAIECDWTAMKKRLSRNYDELRTD